MKTLRRLFLWSLLFLMLLIGFDQLLIRRPFTAPALVAVQTFYIDFRQRLFGLLAHPAPVAAPSIDKLIDQAESAAGKARPRPETAPGPRYLYRDAQGQLQFADSLAEIPAEFRAEAQPLKH